MKDPEFIELRNKFFLGVFIFLLFAVPLFFFLKNKILISDSDLLKSINKKNSMLILLTEDKCNRCSKSKDVLNKIDINYYVLNKSRDRDYNTIIYKLELDKDISIPSLIYVEEGKVYAYIDNIKSSKEITNFIENNNLNGGE